jgi:tRNA(fMet)-specific endonuclease VapC
MTGNKCLLDTTIIVHAFRSNNNIAEKLDAVQEVYVSVTAIGELFYGAYKSADPAKHIVQMKSFLKNCKILLTDTTTSGYIWKYKSCISNERKTNT